MKKKFTSLLLALLFALPALAQRFEYDGLWYNVLDEEAKTCEVVKNNDVNVEDLIIPTTAYYQGAYSVTTIGEYAFGGCSSLASVVIPRSVTTIGDWAFWDCTELAAVG
ncbi:MAG: leucine-rich repeat domain-containing protein, partial [Muribaculaceae bacterium]|nr:leucine-rich repeat domain-containing protein [Muribaculaceae bacterium]